jgi:hypothetical protein
MLLLRLAFSGLLAASNNFGQFFGKDFQGDKMTHLGSKNGVSG